MLRFSVLIALLSLFAVSAFAQQADTTATTAKQQADTTVVAPKAVAPATTPPQTTPPPAAATQTAPQTTSSTATAESESGGRNRRLKLGAGVHYMETIGDIKDAEGFDSGALNLLLGAKLGLGLITIEGDSEWALDYGGSDHTLWLPQVFALVGLRFIYLGAGVGIGYLNQEWFDHPTYSLRAGLILPLGPVAVDLNANYQFMNSSAFDAVDSEDLDSITFGAIVWF